MKKTKQKILDASRKLFNESGYSQVTIRMIALELGMSSGNLNYHFRKREDILEALYFEMVAVFDRRIEELEDQEITIEYTLTGMQTSMERMVDYRFFWTDLYNILKSSQKIKAHFESVKGGRINSYQFLFNDFIKRQLMKSSAFRDEYQLLAERMIDYSNTWLYASALYEHKNNHPEIIEKASFQLLSMIYPYLTDAGQEEFRRVCAVFFVIG